MTLSRPTAKAALTLTLALVSAAAGVGCISRPVSTLRIESSEAAIRNAQELGAERIPDASVHLELARRQLAQARSYIEGGDSQRATWMLLRADADAHLALALTREARTRQAADEVTARVRELANSLPPSSTTNPM